MNEQEINRAIAEECGWKFIPEGDNWKGHAVPQRWEYEGMEYFEDIPFPDFCNDLNAMHKAEKHIRWLEANKSDMCYLWRAYEDQLIRVSCPSWLWHCTARQKAEAFLRTLDKWKD